jgi:hypothetical protein
MQCICGQKREQTDSVQQIIEATPEPPILRPDPPKSFLHYVLNVLKNPILGSFALGNSLAFIMLFSLHALGYITMTMTGEPRPKESFNFSSTLIYALFIGQVLSIAICFVYCSLLALIKICKKIPRQYQ